MASIVVLVTGATGAVGPRVMQAFHSAGFQIRSLSLDVPKFDPPLDGLDNRIGDVAIQATVESAIEGVDIVIHLASLLHINNPSPTLRDKYERINVGGTANVVDASIKSKVKRVVFFSTISVYGCAPGAILTEDTVPQPETFYAQTKLAAERIVLDAKRADGEPLGTVLRLGAIYGGRIKGNYRRLLQSLAHGRFIPIGNGSNRRTLVNDRDVAAAAVLAALHQDAGGRVYNVSDGQFHTLNEIIITMCAALGQDPPRFSLPISPVRFTAGLLEDMARLIGCRSPIGRATVDKYIEDVSASSERIQAELGFVPQYDLAKGWQETIQEMKRLGDL